MNTNIIAAFLTPCVSALTGIMIFLMLEKHRYAWRKTLLIAAAGVLLPTIAGGLVFIYFGKTYYAANIVLTLYLPLILCEYILSGQRNAKMVFTILAVTFLVFVGTTPSFALAMYYKTGIISYNFFRLLIFAVIVVLLKFFVQKPYRRMQDEIEKGWLVFCLLPAAGVFTTFSIGKIYSGNWAMMLSLSIIILIFMISVYAILYYVFLQLSETYVLRERGRLMTMQNHYGKLLLDKQESSIDEMRHLRHDLRHHIRTALSMLEQGAVNEATAQFAHLLEKIDNVALMNFCENRTANYVFSYFYEKAQKENIEISIQASVDNECGIDEVDLGGILSNILENAVEGCQRLPDGTPRSIRLSCMHRDSTILISCENSCVSDILFKDDMPVTSKKSGGIGTQSISRAAAVYNGLAGFTAHNGTFSARVVLHAV